MKFRDLPIAIQELILETTDTPAAIIARVENPTDIYFDETVVDVVDNSFSHEFGTEVVLDFECRFDESDIAIWRAEK